MPDSEEMMAELPLVEGMRRVLMPRTRGRTIRNAAVLRPDRIAWPQADRLPDLLGGQRIVSMERRGKYLGLILENGTLWFHFRMNGALSLEEAARPAREHTHLILTLDDGSELRFRDPRCFALVWFIAQGEHDEVTGILQLGPDALSAELDGSWLAPVLTSRRTIKACLLDQKLIAGIGNIYADEILFHAGIRPDRPIKTLTSEEREILVSCIRRDLTEASDYLSAPPERYLGLPYRPLRHAPRNVYGRSGKTCRRCGSPLVTAKTAGRRTVFCPHCQT